MIHTTVPYVIYRNDNPFFRAYDKRYWEQSEYSHWPETNFFVPDEVQEMRS